MFYNYRLTAGNRAVVGFFYLIVNGIAAGVLEYRIFRTVILSVGTVADRRAFGSGHGNGDGMSVSVIRSGITVSADVHFSGVNRKLAVVVFGKLIVSVTERFSLCGISTRVRLSAGDRDGARVVTDQPRRSCGRNVALTVVGEDGLAPCESDLPCVDRGGCRRLLSFSGEDVIARAFADERESAYCDGLVFADVCVCKRSGRRNGEIVAFNKSDERYAAEFKRRACVMIVRLALSCNAADGDGSLCYDEIRRRAATDVIVSSGNGRPDGILSGDLRSDGAPAVAALDGIFKVRLAEIGRARRCVSPVSVSPAGDVNHHSIGSCLCYGQCTACIRYFVICGNVCISVPDDRRTRDVAARTDCRLRTGDNDALD